MDINEALGRLKGMPGALEIMGDTQGACDLRALMADHARLNDENSVLRAALAEIDAYVRHAKQVQP